MKKEYLILLTAGIILTVIIIAAKRNKSPAPVDIIMPGDKSDEVYGLQSALTSMTGVKFESMGAYDNNTLAAVQHFLKGSYALIDYNKGYVDKRFASDLYLIQSKLKK